MDTTLSILWTVGTLVVGLIIGEVIRLATRPRPSLSEQYADWEASL